MKVLVTAITYLISLAVVAVITFIVVLVLAGPHAGLLPGWMETVVLIIGWLVVLFLPAYLAWGVWRRIAKTKALNHSPKRTGGPPAV